MINYNLNKSNKILNSQKYSNFLLLKNFFKDNKNKENKKNDTFDIEINIKNKEMNEKYGASVELILNQIKKIQETQNILNNMLENVKEAIDNNYTNLNERLKILEYKVDKRNINRKNSCIGLELSIFK